MKKLFKRFAKWLLKEDIEAIDTRIKLLEKKLEAGDDRFSEVMKCSKIQEGLLKSLEASVDVHEYSGASWAVISLKGKKSSYIKFVDLSDRDLCEISKYLRNFENRKVDASPRALFHIDQWFMP